MTSHPPEQVLAGRYRLIRQVGTGKMSTVYEAEDRTRSNLQVAVKLINAPQPDALRREVFRREISALERLEHPNIVQLLDYGRDDARGCAYIVLEYLPTDLLRLLQAQRRNDLAWIWPFVRQLTQALATAHAAGVIHRDLKPTNILVTQRGMPKITDFGISYLKQELATGETVSAFWTPGYAAPEQRGGARGDERSDIYALGCVLFHLLTGSAPPSEGPTEAQIAQLRTTSQIRRILALMLARESGARYQNVRDVLHSLDITRQYDLLPDVYLTLTENARRDLAVKGLIRRGAAQEALDAVTAELGGDDPIEAGFLLDRDRGDVLVLTESLRLICARDPGTPTLTVKAVHVPYTPQLESQRQQALSKRYLWQVISGKLPPDTDQHNLTKTLDMLLAELHEQQRANAQLRARREDRQDLLRPWSAALALQRELMEMARKVHYRSAQRDNGQLIFTLNAPADGLDWPDGAPIALQEGPRRSAFLGHLLAVDGLTLTVSDEAEIRVSPPDDRGTGLPAQGTLGIHQAEAMATLARLEQALGTLQRGDARNPLLPDVLQDLSQARFRPLDYQLSFFQPDLADDKREAVRRALATDDLFVLQGPPGTGKTVTVAEIILQILRAQPDARILLSSQSNVAVNHALTRVAELRASSGEPPLEILRLGREDKIRQGAENWMLTQRLAEWRSQVRTRMDAVVAKLKAQVRMLRRIRALCEEISAGHDPDARQVLQECADLLADLAQDDAPTTNLAVTEGISAPDQGDNLKGQEGLDRPPALAQTSPTDSASWDNAGTRESLALVRAMLPAKAHESLPSAASTKEEYTQLCELVTWLLRPLSEVTAEEERITAQLKLAQDWRNVFGHPPDEFARPLFVRANILAATCLIVGGKDLRAEEFDWAIVDEAGRATPPELLVPLVRARRAILVGDERQLPPMLDEALEEGLLAERQLARAGLERSLFESLTAQSRDTPLMAVQTLSLQHRMHPAIGRLVSEVFYDGALRQGVDAEARTHGIPWIERAVVWLSTSHLPGHFESRQGTGYRNLTEVELICQLASRIERDLLERGQRRTLAVIAPYQAQIAELRQQLLPQSAYWRALTVEVTTVDAAQGKDYDFVLYSSVRSNSTGRLGFLRDRRRLNVALSRARELLILVGDQAMLENGQLDEEGNPYLELSRYFRQHPDETVLVLLHDRDAVTTTTIA